MWTLLELVARGWKSDNGFRAEYLTKIEDSIRSEFPDSDLKGTPHITSKIVAWKRSYGILKSILGRTGIRFNTYGTHKIDCDDEQWEQIVQADKDVKFMRNKSWPFWETWKSIFGKDRASGGGVVDMDGAAALAHAQLESGSQVNENDYHPSLDDIPMNATDPVGETHDFNDNSSGNSGKETSMNKTSSAKCKHKATDRLLMEFLGNLHAETNTRLEMISSRIGYEFDMGKAR